ncbi:MAG: T9SS type A sorting domain-containing protein [Bacteroidia bacterium]|nr:T9SS type A sorting domain-containing protein [Bacteroidia bacterium]
MRKLLPLLFSLLFLKTFSQSGAALNFDGNNDYVTLPNVNTPFNVSASHIKTFQVWFKNTANQGDHVRIFSTGTSNWSPGIWFGYAQFSQFIRFELSDGLGVSGVAITGTTSIRGDNLWHQATGVINGSVAILYLDAILEGTVSISGEGAMNSAGSVHIGNSYDNELASYFQGSVDELRVWDKVLCQPEIMATMNCELTGSESGLVAYYKFNQGIASGNNTGVTSLPDLTINSNNGTLTNMNLTGATSNWVSPGGVTTGSICIPSNPCQSNNISALTSSETDLKLLSDGSQYILISDFNTINEVSIYDLSGKLIAKHFNLNQNLFSFDLNSYSKGVFFVKVKLEGNHIKTFKLLNQ